MTVAFHHDDQKQVLRHDNLSDPSDVSTYVSLTAIFELTAMGDLLMPNEPAAPTNPASRRILPAIDMSLDDEFATLFPEIMHFARLVAGSVADGDDLAVDVASRALPKWRAGQIRDLRAYMRSAVINAHRARHRRAGLARTVFARLQRSSTPNAEGDPLSTVVSESNVEQLLLALTQGEREVIAARFLQDMTVEATAVLLGVTSGTVKSQTSRALRKLRDAQREVG